MDCQYCKRTFSTKGSLTNHQKTTKYCLKIQGKTIVKKVINLRCSGCDKEFKQKGNLYRHYKNCRKSKQPLDKPKKVCNYCYKEFSSKQSLSTHKLKSCIFLQLEDKDKEYKKQLEDKDKEYKKQLEDKDKNYKKQLEDKDKEYKQQISTLQDKYMEYKQQISTLQDKLENIALKNSSQTTINNHNDQRSIMLNNYIDNMKPITPEMLLSYTDNLTEEHVLEGKKGITKYFCEYPMKGNVLCTDLSRKKIKYKDADGNIQTDINLSKLRKGMFQSIKPKVNKLKESIDNSGRFNVNPSLSRGDKKYYENKNLNYMSNIINVCVAIADECKGDTDTELCQLLCKKLLELNNI